MNKSEELEYTEGGVHNVSILSLAFYRDRGYVCSHDNITRPVARLCVGEGGGVAKYVTSELNLWRSQDNACMMYVYA